MNNPQKVLDQDPRDPFCEFGVRYDEQDHIEAIDLVREMLAQLHYETYSSSERKRVLIYHELLRQTLELMEMDGGPTFSLRVSRFVVKELKFVESEDEGKVVGPSLTTSFMGR